MTLAENIKSAQRPELDALASFLTGEFDMQATSAVDGTKQRADAASVVSALSAWAYMQLNAQDQGD